MMRISPDRMSAPIHLRHFTTHDHYSSSLIYPAPSRPVTPIFPSLSPKDWIQPVPPMQMNPSVDEFNILNAEIQKESEKFNDCVQAENPSSPLSPCHGGNNFNHYVESFVLNRPISPFFEKPIWSDKERFCGSSSNILLNPVASAHPVQSYVSVLKPPSPQPFKSFLFTDEVASICNSMDVDQMASSPTDSFDQPISLLKPLTPRKSCYPSRSQGLSASVVFGNEEKIMHADESDSNDSVKLLRCHSDQISLEILSIHDVIGEGSFGKVFRGELCGKEVAVKKLKISKSLTAAERSRAIEKFAIEVSILKSLRHPHIVSFLGICVISNDDNKSTHDVSKKDVDVQYVHDDPADEYQSFCLVTEMCPNGSLLNYLLRKKKLSWSRFFQIADDIAAGLKFLHHKGVIHRDLKPSNLLLTVTNQVKIGDFGLAHVKVSGSNSCAYGVCGTPCYMAPEVLKNEPYGTEADIFSFGIILCQMMTGTYPFSSNITAVHKKSSLASSFEDRIVSGERPTIPDDCLPELKVLLEKCLCQDHRKRPKIDEVINQLSTIRQNLDAAVKGAIDDLLDDIPPDSRVLFEELEQRMQETQAELDIVKSSHKSKCDIIKNLQETISLKSKQLNSANQQIKSQESQMQALLRSIEKLKAESATLRYTEYVDVRHSSISRSSSSSSDVHVSPASSTSTSQSRFKKPTKKNQRKSRKAKSEYLQKDLVAEIR